MCRTGAGRSLARWQVTPRSPAENEPADSELALVPLLLAAHRRYAISKDPVASVAAMVLAALLPTLVLSVSLIARA